MTGKFASVGWHPFSPGTEVQLDVRGIRFERLHLMKIPLLIIALSISTLSAQAEKPTYSIREGEDATSAHYYFLYSDGNSVNRVRWVWNGGASNKPTVTEYLIKSGALEVIKSTGERKQVAALEKGHETKLRVIEHYKISLQDGARLASAGQGAKNVSPDQRVDINNLIDILARERTR